MIPKLSLRGRPKGMSKTWINVKSTKRSSKGRDVPYVKSSITYKKQFILQLLVDQETADLAMKGKFKNGIEEKKVFVEIDKSIVLKDELIDINLVKEFFSCDAWQSVEMLLSEVKKKRWCCYSCKLNLSQADSTSCCFCLNWYHLKCVGLRAAPKQKRTWKCKHSLRCKGTE